MSNMSENDKINATIEKYGDFFAQVAHVDVVQSIKGHWFFMEYDVEHGKYHSFCEFTTADELKRLIAGLIADDANTLLEAGLSEASQSLANVELLPEFEPKDYSDCLPRLVENIKILHESHERYVGLLNRLEKVIECVIRGI